MKVDVKDSQKCRKVVHVEAPPEEVKPEYEKLLNKYKGVATVPGFRKGRAPAEVIEKRFGKDILQETRERLLPGFYKQAVEEADISPVAVIDVSNEKITKEEGMSFDFTVDVEPDFKLPKYSRISLKGEKVEVSDDEVDEAIDRVRENMARYEESSEEPAAPDDMLKIDYRGMAGEQPVREIVGDSSQLGEGTDFWVILSEREFLPGFSKALQGLKAGDSKSVTVDFPVDYQVSELAGKQAVYEVTVKTVRKKRLPEIDEEFLKSMEAESEDDLRQKARDQLMAAKEDNERQRLKNEIADFLLEKTDLQVPDSQVEQEKNVIARNMVQRMAQQGLTRQQLEEQKDDLLKNAAESSVNRVKLMYILRSIADEENVEVGDEELETRVESMAAGYGMEKAQMKAELEKQNSLPRMRSEIRQDKTLDYLLEQAKVKK